jgi:hypothetical protein
MASVIVEERQNALRQKLGGIKIASLFTPERIAKCQQLINTAHDEIRKDTYQRILAMKAGIKKLDIPEESSFRATLLAEAHVVRNTAESLGMNMALEVARTLTLYVGMDKQLVGKQRAITEQLVALLVLLFHDDAADESSIIGREILNSLSQLESRIG